MDHQQIKNWYNQTFFDGNAPRQATASITITTDTGTLSIPAMNVFADSTLHAMILTWYNYLKENPAPLAAPIEPETITAPPPLPPAATDVHTDIVNVDQVSFRDKLYIVEVYQDETFIIKNKETGNVLKPDSPNAKAIIKLVQPGQAK